MARRKVERKVTGAAIGTGLASSLALVLVWASNGFGPLDLDTAGAIGIIVVSILGAFGFGWQTPSPTSTVSTGHTAPVDPGAAAIARGAVGERGPERDRVDPAPGGGGVVVDPHDEGNVR